jgi:hypothetical protein
MRRASSGDSAEGLVAELVAETEAEPAEPEVPGGRGSI